MTSVVFACVHNAGRSQMAAAFLNHLGQGKARAVSAGTNPGTRVHPEVVEAMKEVGIARDDWPLEDPQGRSLDDVRRIRDEIRRRVVELLND